MTIRAITAVLTIAGTTFLVGCDEHQEASGSAFFKALGVNDLAASSPAPAVAYVTEVVEEVSREPDPLPPACENYVWRAVIYTCDGVAIGTVN
jgi:hypothetical protein